MEITDIPYAQTIGLVKGEDGILRLNYDESLFNHVQTIAAAAQFSLAELASGEHLLALFPALFDQVVPVLRDSRLQKTGLKQHQRPSSCCREGCG